MANWSTDSYFFGRLKSPGEALEHASYAYTSEQQEVIRSLRFKPYEDNSAFYNINGIGAFGPALLISGGSEYGSPPPLTDECWDWLNAGVVVHEGHDGFSENWDRTITINGERVFEQHLPMYPEGDTPEAELAHAALDLRWSYVGRTPEERHFFDALFEKLKPRKKCSKMERLTGHILNPPSDALEVAEARGSK